MSTGDILTLLLGGGAVATIGAFFQGVKSLQSGARAREKETVGGLVKDRKDAIRERDFSEDVADYWRQWAARVQYEAGVAGVELPERPSEPVRPIYDDEEQS